MDSEIAKFLVTNRDFPGTVIEHDFGDICHNSYDQVAAVTFIDQLNMVSSADETGQLVTGVTLAINGPTDSFIWEFAAAQRIVHVLDKILCGVMYIGTLTLDLRGYKTDLYSVESLVYRNLHLPHLEQVTFNIDHELAIRYSHRQLCKRILAAAPNLKAINGRNSCFLFDQIFACNKAACVKHYKMPVFNKSTWQSEGSVGWQRQLQHSVQISRELQQAMPVLDSFHVPSDVGLYFLKKDEKSVELKNAATQVLVTFQNTLKTVKILYLSLLDGYDKVEHPDPPIFPKLVRLEFKNAFVSPLFPQEFSPSASFPCLRYVKLKLRGLLRDYLRTYFFYKDKENQDLITWPSVETLELACPYDKKGMEMITKIFPNVANIIYYQDIGSYEHSAQNGIWNLPPKVESVTLHFVAKNYTSKVGNLDELFTGIGRKVLKRLPRDSIQNAHEKTALRNGVRKLKALKQLKVIFDVNERKLDRTLTGRNPSEFFSKELVQENLGTPFFLEPGAITVLSGLYGFNTQNFQTCFCYDKRVHCARAIQKMLEPLKPYVSIDPDFISDTTPDLSEDLVSKATRVVLNDLSSVDNVRIEAPSAANTEENANAVAAPNIGNDAQVQAVQMEVDV